MSDRRVIKMPNAMKNVRIRSIKKETRKGSLILSTDGRGSKKSNRSCFYTSQVQRKIMCVPFVHYLEPEICTIQNVSPGVNNTTVIVKQGLVKVETVALNP